MRSLGEALRQDAGLGAQILNPLETAGVDQWADSAAIIRCRSRVTPNAQWGVRRECLRRARQHFDRAGIEIPFPRIALVSPQAPAVPIKSV